MHMWYLMTFVLYFLDSSVYCDLEKYNVVIIPVSKIAIRPKKVVELTINDKIDNTNSRLNIEQYGEPKAMEDNEQIYFSDSYEPKVKIPQTIQLYPNNRLMHNRAAKKSKRQSRAKAKFYNNDETEAIISNNPGYYGDPRKDYIAVKQPVEHIPYFNDDDDDNNREKIQNHKLFYESNDDDQFDIYNKDYNADASDSDETKQNSKYKNKIYNNNNNNNNNYADATYAENKIVGGYDVEINLYPYHVGYGTNCGGAIIDKKWVITAGHCGNKPYIKIGSKHLNQGKKVAVKNHFVHPMWSARNKDHPFDYDFQLLELAEPLKFDENIQAIKVAHIEDMVIGKVITVTGWGNTKENGPYSTVLRAIRVPIISKENCQNVPFPYFRGSLTPRMFCAGFKEGKKDACQGDSGGPAVAYDRLLGMVSFGYGCATPGSYGVYSKVAKVRSWIEQTTGLTLS